MRELLPFLLLFKRYSWRILFGILLTTVTLLASIGLLSVSGWFLAGTAVAGLVGGYFNYMLPAAGVRGSAILRTFGRYAERIVSHDTTFRILAKLRVHTFSKLLPLTPGKIAQYKQSELLNRLIADIDTLDHLYLRLLSPIISALVATGLVTLALWFIDSSIAILLAATMFSLILIMPVLFYLLGKRAGQNLIEQRSDYRQQLTTFLQGQAELTIFNALDSHRAELDKTERRWQAIQKKQTSLAGTSQAIVILLAGLTSTLILWIAASDVSITSSGPLLALFVFVALAIFEVLPPIATAFLFLSQVISAASNLNQLLSQKPDVCFDKNSTVAQEQVELTINNLSFTYPNQPIALLKQINLEVKPGQHIAILGKTGCGKSTLLQLITRAWDIDEGMLLFNQTDIKALSETTLRQLVSVIPQRVHIFSATLRHNLALASANRHDQDFINVLTQVGLDYLLGDEGLDLWLGEGGRQLSGGEQRRIAIARALLHDAPLILLDEPTEGLDNETESKILELLRQHCQNKSLIMVTHRLTSLDKMDTIIIMENGQIVEQGCHRELMGLHGIYFQYHQELM